jgi:TolB protein
MGSDGHEPHAVSSPPGAVVAAEWSPDGHNIAVAAAVESAFSHEVFILDFENLGAPPRKVPSALADLGGSLEWSPDQSHLLVFAGPAAAREIYRLDIASGQATQLTFGGNNASPSYSPDGRDIVFNSLRNGGQADLYVMRADGHSMRRLTDNPEPDWQPKWGP